MKQVLILGAGALGSNIAATLAVDLKNKAKVTVLDMDEVEERNVRVGTQMYTRDQIGQRKVEALQYNIYKWSEIEIGIIDTFLSSENYIATLSPWMTYDTFIIDCFDNHMARSLVQKFAEEYGANVLHAGFSRDFTFAVEGARGYKVPTDITSGFDICEIGGAGGFVKMVASAAASVALDYIMQGKERELLGNRFSVKEIK